MVSNDIKITNESIYAKFNNRLNTPVSNYAYNNYTANKIYYYNDEKKSKNKKIKRNLIIGTVGFTLASATIFALGNKGFKIDKLKSTTKTLWEKIRNASVNLTNLKDDAWDRFATFLHEKTPLKFVKNTGDKFSDWYRSNVYKSLEKSFKKAQEDIINAKGGEQIKPQIIEYKTLFENLDKNIRKAATDSRISSKETLLKGKKGKLNNLISNISSPIGDNNIIGAVKNSANLIKIPENADEKLKNAIEHYNKLQQDMLIPKLRDINYGCAPTDIITVGIPVAAFGVAMANADNKEERNSLLLNLGIPLLPTLVMPIIGTIFPILNGMTAIIAGLAVGQVASQTAKIIDKKINNNSENKA